MATKAELEKMLENNRKALMNLKEEYEELLDEVKNVKESMISGYLPYKFQGEADKLSLTEVCEAISDRIHEIQNLSNERYKGIDVLQTKIAHMEGRINQIKADAFDEIMRLKRELEAKS